MSDEPHPLVKALQRKLNTQVDRIDELEDRVAELEELVDPDPGNADYEQLTKEQKVFRVRKHLLKLAHNTNGRASMKYKEVMALFNGHPSPGHCYNLMERAGERDGYVYDKAGGGQGEKRIRVKSEEVNDETLIQSVNKETKSIHAWVTPKSTV